MLVRGVAEGDGTEIRQVGLGADRRIFGDDDRDLVPFELVGKRFDVGQTARTDVLRSKATLEDARRALIQSQAALTLARNTLSNILNMGGRDEFTLVEPSGAAFDAVHSTCAARRFDSRYNFRFGDDFTAANHTAI